VIFVNRGVGIRCVGSVGILQGCLDAILDIVCYPWWYPYHLSFESIY